MGFVDFMETRAQRELTKRAIDASWVASCGIGMVFGPLCLAVESSVQANEAGREEVDSLVRGWLESWERVRHLSDRNLHRNRAYHAVRPNLELSPALESMDTELRALLASSELSASDAVERCKECNSATMLAIYEFQKWVKQVAPMIGFNPEGYENGAVRKGQMYWKATVKQLMDAS